MFNITKAAGAMRTFAAVPTTETIKGHARFRMNLRENETIKLSTLQALENSVEGDESGSKFNGGGDDVAITKILNAEDITAVAATMWLAKKEEGDENFRWGVQWRTGSKNDTSCSVGIEPTTAAEAIKAFNSVTGAEARALM